MFYCFARAKCMSHHICRAYRGFSVEYYCGERDTSHCVLRTLSSTVYWRDVHCKMYLCAMHVTCISNVCSIQHHPIRLCCMYGTVVITMPCHLKTSSCGLRTRNSEFSLVRHTSYPYLRYGTDYELSWSFHGQGLKAYWESRGWWKVSSNQKILDFF